MTKSKPCRKVIFFKHYYSDFFYRQSRRVKDKIIWTLDLIEHLPLVPEQYLKHIEGTDGLYEIRIQSGRNIFRIFCFFDSGQLVILINGFQKKTEKTPKAEIKRALKIKLEYEKENQK